MKKIFLALVALFATLSMDAQIIRVYKNNGSEPVATFINHADDNYKVVFDPMISVTGVTLSKETTSISVGANRTLTATIAPENASIKIVNWKSSNTAVATVDADGKVAGVAAGEATITATAADGSGIFATCSVTVTPIYVTSITLNKTRILIKSGDDYSITATVAPENATFKTVNWTSSNTSVATVDAHGKVTGVAEGEATITATAADGSGIYATCAVEVDDGGIEPFPDIDPYPL